MAVSKYVTKKGVLWMARVRIGGRQVSKKGFRSRADAILAERELLVPTKSKAPLLSKVAEDFFRIQSTQLKSSTLRALKGRYRNHIVKGLKDLPMDSYGYPALSAWWEGLKSGSLKEKNAVLGLLKAIFRHSDVYFGYRNREVEKLLPYRDFSVHAGSERPYLTFGQFSKVLALEKDPFFRLYLLVSFFTGMRISEVRGLQGKCFDGSRLHVFQQVQSKCDGTGWRLTTPKTRSSVRSYLLPSFLADMISEHVKSNGIGPDSFLFFGRSKRDVLHLTPVSENTLTRELRRLSKASGIGFTSHSFRHGEATLLASKGVAIEEIGRYLGHSSPEITRAHYVHETEEEKARIAALLDRTFKEAFPTEKDAENASGNGKRPD